MSFLKMLTAMLAGRRRVENTAPVYQGIYRGGGTSDARLQAGRPQRHAPTLEVPMSGVVVEVSDPIPYVSEGPGWALMEDGRISLLFELTSTKDAEDKCGLRLALQGGAWPKFPQGLTREKATSLEATIAGKAAAGECLQWLVDCCGESVRPVLEGVTFRPITHAEYLAEYGA